MKKLIISSILILSMLFLSSCFIGGSRTDMLNQQDNDKVAEARLAQVIEAIKNKDKDAMKLLFSVKALSETEDFNGNMDELFNIFLENVDSWEILDGGPVVFQSNDHGHITKEIDSSFYVISNKQKYYISLDDFPIDTDHPENVGIYLLLVAKAEDHDKIWDGEQKIMFDGNIKIPRAGIYIPFE